MFAKRRKVPPPRPKFQWIFPISDFKSQIKFQPKFHHARLQLRAPKSREFLPLRLRISITGRNAPIFGALSNKETLRFEAANFPSVAIAISVNSFGALRESCQESLGGGFGSDPVRVGPPRKRSLAMVMCMVYILVNSAFVFGMVSASLSWYVFWQALMRSCWRQRTG